MNRRPSLRSLAAAAVAESTASSSAMSSHPYFRGWRPQGRRGYSNRPSTPATGDQPEFVSGDSHFRAVRDANCSYRPSYNAVPPSPPHFTGQHFAGPRPQPHRPGPPVNRPYRDPRQVGPAIGNHQRFRPQHTHQQFRPRDSKPPDYRDWEYAKPGPPSHFERFTILSYNILADYLAADHWEKLYFHIPDHIMDWTSRKRSLIFELGLWSADILCFQEVDRFQDLETELKPRGYNGIWKMRTGDPVDGCAIFWRVSRFKLLHEESIEYNKLGLRDNVAQICVFESLKGQKNSDSALTPSSSNRVVVCNIHVLFNPKRGDIKLGQVRILLDRAHSVSKLWDDAPIVICGDFNCTPKSPLYNFISEQKLDLSELPRDRISGQVSAEIRPSRPNYPYYRTESPTVTAQVSAVNSEKEEGDLPLNAQKLTNTHDPTNDSSVESNSKTGSAILNGESTNTDFIMDTRFESDEFVVETNNELPEDSNSFLSELHNSTVQSPFPGDLSSSSQDYEIQNRGIPYAPREVFIEEGKFSFNSSTWTPMEIETATGSEDCKVMEHPLKLNSAYAVVENSSGLRDSSGEPFVTSYHRRFLGTVDYIWVSEGLQPAKVLAPIPKHVMQHTRGFPTKKWGSDHVALVSELAFTKDISSQSSSQ